MKLIALVSGGKDSVLAMMEAVKRGHQIACLANLRPPSDAAPSDPCEGDDGEEIDSHCFQTCGYRAVDHIAQCMDTPLRTRVIREGQSVATDLVYLSNNGDEPPSTGRMDEVEEMYQLLKSIKEEFPEVGGVCSGAILSTYQRLRVEDVCRRLGLTSFSYLWQLDGATVLRMVREDHVDARLIKTASMGLNPRRHLGRSLADEDLWELLTGLEKKYQVHPAGEGGEFESIVLDCPLFASSRLSIASSRIIMVEDNPYAPLGRLAFDTVVVGKTDEERAVATQWRVDLPASLPEFHTVPSAVSLPALTKAVTMATTTSIIGGDAVVTPSEHVDAFIADNAVPCATEEDVRTHTLNTIKESAVGSGGLVRVTVQCGSSACSPPDQMRMLLSGLIKATSNPVIFIQIYAPCISAYKAINKAYEEEVAGHTLAGYTPGTFPARAFVARGLPNGTGPLALSATFHVGTTSVSTLRVESVSLWAAAAIGPYSQGLSFAPAIRRAPVVTNDSDDDDDDVPPSCNTIVISGRVGMVPSTLDLISTSPSSSEGGKAATLAERFSLEFCSTVLNVITGLAVLMPRGPESGIWGPTATEALVLLLGGVSPLTVFVTSIELVPLVAPAWGALGLLLGVDVASLRPLQCRIVPQLPKGAMFELVSLISVSEVAPLL